jgi:hypothetical protein
LLKAILALGRLVGALLALLRKIPVIDDLCDRASSFWLNPIVVRRIRRPSDRDLDAALRLYETRIPPEDQFQSDDIIRWVRDDLMSRSNRRDRPRDWFLVAKHKRAVGGFILFHYFPQRRVVFLAYMAVAKKPGMPADAISLALCRAVSKILVTAKELRGCEKILLEVDDPRHFIDAKKRSEAIARIARFCKLGEMHGHSIRALDIPYRQPKLSLNEGAETERPLILLCAQMSPGALPRSVSRAVVEDILSFIYMDLYPECFSADPQENEEYLKYCIGVRDKSIGALSDPVRSISCAELVSKIRNRGKQRRPLGRRTEVAEF